MIAKPNRIPLRCPRPPAPPKAAALIQLQRRATAAPARSFVFGVGLTQTFIAPTTCEQIRSLPPMPPRPRKARVLDRMDPQVGSPLLCLVARSSQILRLRQTSPQQPVHAGYCCCSLGKDILGAVSLGCQKRTLR